MSGGTSAVRKAVKGFEVSVAEWKIDKLVVIGVGLIGGSFALALRKAGKVHRVVGVGRGRKNLEQAKAYGVIDEAAGLPEALKGADLVLLAVPGGQAGAILAQMAPHLDSETVVTDAGSTKQDVLALARVHLTAHLSRFVPAHPIAGSEKSGVVAASASLFHGRKVVLTPLSETVPEARQRVKAAWEACGAQVLEMEPQAHDEALALVSHLPHLLAFALMDRVASRADGQKLLALAGTGFRDFTRIAGSSPEMWRDICLANREALLAQIDAYQGALSAIRSRLAAADGAALEALFARARAERRRWLEKK